MRKTILVLPLALILGVAGATFVSAQPQQRPGAGAPPVRELPRTQRAPVSPEQLAARRAGMCQTGHARAAGRLAEMEIRLNLAAGQQTAFTRWRDIRLAAAKRRADACAAAPVRRDPQQDNAQAAPPSPVDRMAREEQQLRQRLADLTAERPALEALYNSLTPEQRRTFTPMGGPGMGRGGPRPRMAMMLRERFGGGGPRGGLRGPGGPGRMGPNGPGMAPPPPPPQ